MARLLLACMHAGHPMHSVAGGAPADPPCTSSPAVQVECLPGDDRAAPRVLRQPARDIQNHAIQDEPAPARRIQPLDLLKAEEAQAVFALAQPLLAILLLREGRR